MIIKGVFLCPSALRMLSGKAAFLPLSFFADTLWY